MRQKVLLIRAVIESVYRGKIFNCIFVLCVSVFVYSVKVVKYVYFSRKNTHVYEFSKNTSRIRWSKRQSRIIKLGCWKRHKYVKVHKWNRSLLTTDERKVGLLWKFRKSFIWLGRFLKCRFQNSNQSQNTLFQTQVQICSEYVKNTRCTLQIEIGIHLIGIHLMANFEHKKIFYRQKINFVIWRQIRLERWHD